MSVRRVTAGPLFPDDGPVARRLWRRARGIAIEGAAFLVLTVLFPIAVIIAGIVDLVLWLRRRKPWMAVRLVAMAWWFLFGELDKNIPAELHRFMAERAGSRRTVEIKGGSHSVGIPEAAQVVDVIREAATQTASEPSAT